MDSRVIDNAIPGSALRASALLEDAPGFDSTQLAPTLIQLGLAIGLLRTVGGDPNSVELNADWFKNPLAATGSNLSNNGAHIASLFSSLLGEISASALGLPAQDLGAMGVWNPIPNPMTGLATGFYLVNYPLDAALPDGDQVFGIGILHSWAFSAGSEQIDVRVWGLLPVLQIGSTGFSLVLGKQGYALNMGAEFAGAAGAKLIDSNGFSFNGVKFSALLDILGSPTVDLSVVILQLQLPTDTVPADRNLSQIEQITPQEWLSTVATLFVSALEQVLGQDQRASNLLPIFGLSPIVPGSSQRLPLLAWDQLISQGQSGAPLFAPFVNWFNALLAEEGAFAAWMGAIGGLLGIAAPSVSGSGSALDPYLTEMISDPAYGALSLSMVTQVDASGVRYLLPGLRLNSAGIQLGKAPAQIVMQAQLDLAQFALASSGQLGLSTRFLNLNMGIALTNTVAGQPLFEGSVGSASYVFGSVSAGLAVFQSPNLALKVVPAFRLDGVTTPTGQYASIDLTQPGQLVDQALTELYGLVDAALASVFGLDDPASCGHQAAVLLGVIAPTLASPLSWPADLAPPFAASQLIATFQQPVSALANYYQGLVQQSNAVGGQLPVYYLLQAAASLLNSAAGSSVTLSGSGTVLDPWLYALTTGALPASLLASVDGEDGAAKTLMLGLRLAPSVSFGSADEAAQLDLVLDVRALSLLLPAVPAAPGDAALQACIFPGVAVSIALPQALSTPAVAGAAISIDNASFSGSWSPYDGWLWNLAVGQPAVIVDGTRMPVGTSMVFSDLAALAKLVSDDGAVFAPIVQALIGVALYRTGNRPGLAANAILGLLPDLSAFVPAGLDWPANMPTLKPSGFSDPVGDVKRQLAALLADGASAVASLALLGWSVRNDASVPAVAGQGTLDAPWSVPVALPGGIELAVWGGDNSLGLGLSRPFGYSGGAIAADSQLLLRCLEIGLNGAAPLFAPGVSLRTTITPATPLQISGVGSLLSLQLGLSMTLEGGVLALAPQLTLSIDSSAGASAWTLQEIASATSQWTASFYTALNAGVDQLITPLLGNAAIDNAYQLLALMNLVVPIQSEDGVAIGNQRAAVDAAGWAAMVADPLGFFSQSGIALFADANSRAQAVALLQAISGITLPAIPLPLLQVLNAFDLVEDQAAGFAPRIYDWASLLSHPAQQLQQRFMALIADGDRSSALIDQLSLQIGPVTVGPLRLSVAQGVQFRIELAKPILLGDLLELRGAIGVGLRSGELVAHLSAFAPSVQLDLRTGLNASASGLAFTALLGWGDGSQPMPQALTLYPFDPALFLRQATALAPTFALSTFFTQVVDAKLLNDYQLARTAMSALGLAFEDAASKRWYTKSPLGLFDDPLQWLLGDAVLGANGQLNIATLARVLATITTPVTAANGVGVAPIANGLRIVGLPYSQQIDLVADTSAQTFTITPGLAGGASLPLADGVTLATLWFALTLGTNFQPGLAGAVAIKGKLGASTTLQLDAGYQDGFSLSAKQVESGQTFQVLPFPGWQTLVLQAAQQSAQALLTSLTGVLLDQLSKAGAEDFVTNLRAAGTALQVPALVSSLIANTDKGLDAIGAAALAWLTGRLSTENAAATAGAAATLLSPYFKGVSASAGLLSYQPSTTLPVTLLSGLQTLGGVAQVGLWIQLDLAAGEAIVLAIAPTGIGIPVNPDGTPVANFTPQLNFQLSVVAALQDGCGPALSMRYGAASGAFVLGIDPAGSAQGSASDSSYYRELLPTFFGETDSSKWGAAVLSWLESILLNIVPRYMSIVLLNQSAVKAWLEAPLLPNNTGPSAANILLASQLVIKDDAQYMLNSFDALASLTLEQFIAGFFRALLASEFKLISIGSSGGIWLGPRAGREDYFGLRVMVPDMALAAVPYVTFQLGDVATDWIKNAGGDASLQGGISLYVPISTTAPDFGKLLLELVNIGMDFHGKEQQNLVQMSRFALKAVQPRGLITFDFGQSSPVQSFGGAVTLSDMSISLAPSAAVSGAGVNPVAQNLLGSGSASAPKTDSSATNPAFSVQVAYVNKLYVDLIGDDGSNASQVWFEVQRSFGPLYANKIGVGWKQSDYQLGMLFDGSVSMAGLYIGLDTLSIGVPVTTPLDYSAYSLDLAGIDVSFKGGAVELAGGFLKLDNPLHYNGKVTVKAARFGLMALGSYALVPVDAAKPDGEKAASLFIFANLNLPLGPDPAFFITGIAAGFGYNRDLKIPAVDEIHKFPLVLGAIDSSTFAGDDPNSALEVMSQVVYPQIGQYWAAGGIAFSTYELLNSFALLIVRFGREFAIDLIGISSASFPPNAAPENALAYVELALLVSFHPDEGVISARAQLTPNSFVLSKDCHLTGGFAAVVWYKGEHAGDFVITLGGYNPAFSVPDYYPNVPRLGFNWPMDLGFGSLNISGGTYFALTPSALMAGGYLKVLFQTGPLRAWFDAGVDFLIQWQPFYFLMQGHVSVGAGFETTIAGVKLSLSAQLGARLVLWGPPIAGEVSVDWYVISFTIPFGDTSQLKPATQPLDWDAFQLSFLPPVDGDHSASLVREKRSHPQLLMLASAALTLPAPPAPVSQAYAVLKLQAGRGLIEDYPGLGWIVQTPFELNLTTVIPATSVAFAGSTTTFSGPAIGIAPMGQPTISSALAVTLFGFDSSSNSWSAVDLDVRNIGIAITQTGSPEALWSKNAFDPNGVPAAKTIHGSILGAALQGAQVLLYAAVGPIDLLTLQYVTLGPLPLPFTGTPTVPAQPAGSQLNRAEVIAATIMDALTVVPLRSAMYAALRAFGQPALVAPDLSVLQNNVTNIYQSVPSLATLAMDMLPATAVAAAPRLVQTPVKALRTLTEPDTQTRLIGTSRRYRASGPARTLGKAGTALPVQGARTRATWVDGHAVQHGPTVLRAGVDAAPLQLHLSAGSTSIIRLGNKAPRSLQIGGGLPVRLCAFNAYQEPLQQKMAAADTDEHVLPDDTHEVVAIAGASAQGEVAGWYHDSLFTRLNHYYFHGDGCLVRPQAPPVAPLKLNARIKPPRRGPIDGGVVLASNRVSQANGDLAPGWIETLFLEKVASFTVLVSGAADVRVQCCWTDSLAMPAYADAAVVLASWRAGEVQVLQFAVPAGAANGQDLAVLVQPAPGSILRGVLGFASEASAEHDIAGLMASTAAHSPGPATPVNAPPVCHITVH